MKAEIVMIPLEKAKHFTMVAIANAMGRGEISEPDARGLVATTEHELDWLGRQTPDWKLRPIDDVE